MSDSEYRSWIKTFFEGSFLADGWNAQVNKLIGLVHGTDAEAFKAKLQALGERIASEWAKANDVRKIDTEMLKTWGSDLQKGARHGAESLHASIAAIETRINELLGNDPMA